MVNDGSMASESVAPVPQAAESVTIDGREYRLEAYLWRDYMPRVGMPQSHPLFALAWVTAVDRAPVGNGLVLDGIWLVHGDDTWHGRFADEPRGQDPARAHQLEGIARDGPEWPVGDKVTVVVRFHDPDGRMYHLRLDGQLIRRTA